MEGLSEEMQDKLAALDFSDFNHLVNKVIIVEDKMNKLEAKRRKRAAPPSMGMSLQRPRVGVLPPPRAPTLGYPQPPMMVRHPPTPGQPQRPVGVQGIAAGS